jgi:hypothetical protein
MATPGRTGLLAAAWLVTAIGAGLLGAFAMRPAPEIRFVDRSESGGATPNAMAPADATASGRSASGEPEAGVPPAPGEDPPSRGPASATWIEIAVRGADGGPLVNEPWLEAYALPAGSRGADDLSSVPNAAFPSAETGRIPIAMPGRYDVGVIGPGVFAFAQDVVVDGGATVRVDLAPAPREPATFRIEGPVPRDRRFAVTVSIVSTGEVSARPYPGRGESPSIESIQDWTLEEPAIVHLPREREFAFGVSVRELREERRKGTPLWVEGTDDVDPWTTPLQPWHGIVRAGDAVTLRFAEPAKFKLNLRTEPPVPPGTLLDIEGTLVQGRTSVPLRYAMGPEGDREGSAFVIEWTGIPGPATLRWRPGRRGPGHPAVDFAPGGPIEFVLEAGKVVEIPVEIRIDPGPALLALDAGPVRIVPRLPGGGPPPTEGISMFTFRRDPDSGEADEWAQWTDQAEEGGFVLDAGQRSEWTHFVVVGTTGLVSAPLAMPQGGTAEVDLLPGGYLLVATDALPPPGHGLLRIRRLDGAVMALTGADSDGRWGVEDVFSRPVVRAGTILGPLPEGTHAFEAFLGGVRVGEASARVTAGRIGILRIPTR